MMLMYGSTVFMIRVTDRLVTDRRVWAVPYLFPGTWCLEAGMATSGTLTRWFRDQCAPDLIAVEEEGGPVAYAELAKAAADIAPGSEGLIVLPYFSGERTPINDPQARGVIFGLTLAHTRAHMFRAILEGIGYGVRHHVDVMTEMGVRPEEIVAVGGGTQNEAWMQVVSDIAEIDQRVPAITLGASYGDAFLAGLGIGIFESYADIGSWLTEERTVAPNPARRDVYRHLMKLYVELYQRTKDLMAALGRIA
jgi:xylulokinase